MAYDAQTVYSKFNKKSCGCSGSDSCDSCKSSCETDECGCCPVGLVGVTNADDDHVACLTPNDAQEYYLNVYKCKDGYVKVIVGGIFMGCLTPEEYIIYTGAGG